MSLAILALYGWAYMADVQSISSSLLVTDEAAVIAAVALVVGFISYLWTPKTRLFWSSLISFLTLATLVCVLVISTGGHTSPFIALWMMVAVFAGVFGWLGLLPLFLATLGYAISLISNGAMTNDAIITICLAGELPLLFSFVIWHTKSSLTNPGARDRAYNELATELSEVANKAEVVINAIADGVVALNSKGVIQLINPAAQKIIGWGKQDALSLDYKSVVKLLDKNGHHVEPSLDPIAQVLASNEKIVTNDLQLSTNSDKKIMVSVSVSPVGQLGSGVIIIFRDITKEKSEERAQAEFISTASHEMRTPVATIEGYLGLALNPATAQIDDKAREFITKAHDSAQHLGRLFADLLDVSKAEDGRLTSDPKVVDVVAYVEDIADGLRAQAAQKGLVLIYKPSPDGANEKTLGERRLSPVFYANVDNDHLREVVGNLIENAIKYTPQGNITVDVSGTATHITVSVADSGIGIPKEDQAHLFQKFYRVDNTDTREIGGTGLGLYLSRRLAESMEGRLWVESDYRQGSTFHLEIPRVSHEDAMHAIEMVEAEVPSTPLQSPTELTVPPVASVPVPTTPVAPQPIAPPLQQQAPQPPIVQPLQPAPQSTPVPVSTPQFQQPAAPAAPTGPIAYYQAPAMQRTVSQPDITPVQSPPAPTFQHPTPRPSSTPIPPRQ